MSITELKRCLRVWRSVFDFGLKDFSTFLETFDNSMFLQIGDTL